MKRLSVIEGKGTVWIDDVLLSKVPSKQAHTLQEHVDEQIALYSSARGW